MAEPPARGRNAPTTEPEPTDILAPGPILGLGAFLIGATLHLRWPIGVLPPPWHLLGGPILLVGGVGIVVWGLLTMRRIEKSPSHHDEPSHLLTTGPFAYTRNPLYLGIVVAYLGLTALLNSVWPLAPLLVLVWYFDRVAKREERFLEAKFGEAYTDYRDDVRRWL